MKILYATRYIRVDRLIGCKDNINKKLSANILTKRIERESRHAYSFLSSGYGRKCFGAGAWCVACYVICL
nr:unnamed protein product [Callosobruchus analis]